LTVNRAEHWQQVYTAKGERDVSWFQAEPEPSLSLLEAAGMTPRSSVLDVGGGDSRLVDALLARGVTAVAVLDISAAALERARRRLGPAADVPAWIVADVTGDWSVEPVDIWHDRAVFHFLTNPVDREAYRRHLRTSVRPGGAVIVATFAPDGPARCSGLPVVRYSPESLAQELGSPLRLVQCLSDRHLTPSGAEQAFQYSRFVIEA
jgi:SAM-dependent methyltransferase